jgi:hypothetical protein
MQHMIIYNQLTFFDTTTMLVITSLLIMTILTTPNTPDITYNAITDNINK